MGRHFVITESDLESIEDAIRTLREHVQAGGAQTEASVNEARSALAGLLCIYPKSETTWSQGGAT